jgi:prolyl-tRNA synthetase
MKDFYMANKKLPSKSGDFSAWYHDVIYNAQLVDESPTRGCIVFRPYGYAIWEHIQKNLDARFKAQGVENAYFPLLIPESFLKKEADHVEGFAPETAVVTHAGGKKLEEPYVIRPTSETMIYHMFARWISSWRDMPLKVNQWANVMRWEMRTRPFLRTAEILWQEGHSAHATRDEADAMACAMHQLYIDFLENDLCIPVFVGRKTDKERFAGADTTYTMEAMMPDGKALQMGTSHLLAHSFPAAYGVKFQDKEGVMQSPWCVSFGMTTRTIGAAVMVHGDDGGLVLPPAVAPYQVVIVPIFRNDDERVAVLARAEEYRSVLACAGIRVHCDVRDERPGAKFFHWELRGAPVRIELGPRDVAAHTCVAAVRVAAEGADRKRVVSSDALLSVVNDLLAGMQETLRTNARAYRDAQTIESTLSGDAFFAALADHTGFVRAPWCGDVACENVLAKQQASIRCILDQSVASDAECFSCQAAAINVVVIAKSY